MGAGKSQLGSIGSHNYEENKGKGGQPVDFGRYTSDIYQPYGGLEGDQLIGAKPGTRVRPRVGPRADMRFAATSNQMRKIWYHYNSYLHCTNVKGAYNKQCERMWFDVQAITPPHLLEMWYEQRVKKRFPGVQSEQPIIP
eukprot:335713_1